MLDIIKNKDIRSVKRLLYNIDFSSHKVKKEICYNVELCAIIYREYLIIIYLKNNESISVYNGCMRWYAIYEHK